MTGRPDEERRGAIRDDSDELIRRLGELRDLETEKRGEQMSSPRFHDLAREITRKSQEIFRLAAHEERTGDGLSRTQERSIEDEAVGE